MPVKSMMLAKEWKLVPVGSKEWELCRLTEKGWVRQGEPYTHENIDQAMLIVIGELAEQGERDQMLALASAMKQWQDGIGRMTRAAKSWE